MPTPFFNVIITTNLSEEVHNIQLAPGMWLVVVACHNTDCSKLVPKFDNSLFCWFSSSLESCIFCLGFILS